MKRKEEIKAKGKGHRAKGEGQRTESHWSLVIEKQMPVGALSIAVDFSQRNREHDINSGLKPHSMWQKSKGQSAGSQGPRAEDQQRVTSNKQPATREFSTVFQIKNLPQTAEGCISESRAIRACPTIRLFNN